MFDPAKYYELVTDILWSRKDEIFLDPNTGFNVFPDRGRWQTILWRASLHFENTGHVLEIYETYSRDLNGKPLRRRNYRLVDAGQNQVFLFDTHGRECGFDEPCHVHTSTQEEIENGHGRLRGYDLADMDFSKVFRLAYRYIFEGEKLPWE